MSPPRYQKAALQNDSTAQLYLGHIYYAGEYIKKNKDHAFMMYRRAADQNDSRAQNNISCMFLRGEGCKPNLRMAVYFCRRAAEQGHSTAQHNLGVLFYCGRGVIQDKAMAVTWCHRAAEQGYTRAHHFLRLIADDVAQESIQNTFSVQSPLGSPKFTHSKPTESTQPNSHTSTQTGRGGRDIKLVWSKDFLPDDEGDWESVWSTPDAREYWRNTSKRKVSWDPPSETSHDPLRANHPIFPGPPSKRVARAPFKNKPHPVTNFFKYSTKHSSNNTVKVLHVVEPPSTSTEGDILCYGRIGVS